MRVWVFVRVRMCVCVWVSMYQECQERESMCERGLRVIVAVNLST